MVLDRLGWAKFDPLSRTPVHFWTVLVSRWTGSNGSSKTAAEPVPEVPVGSVSLIVWPARPFEGTLRRPGRGAPYASPVTLEARLLAAGAVSLSRSTTSSRSTCRSSSTRVARSAPSSETPSETSGAAAAGRQEGEPAAVEVRRTERDGGCALPCTTENLSPGCLCD